VFVAVALLGVGCGSGETGTSGTGGTTSGTGGTTSGTTAPVDPLTYSVLETGPFTCGHRVLEATYTLPAGKGDRTVPVHVWYPSTVAEGDHPKYRNLFEDTHAWDDVPLADSPWKEGFPVIVHSHGYKGFAGNSARLMCHFASHGWVAVAPEHVGNTIGDTPDPLPLAVYYERPLDVRAALDLAASPPAGDPLTGKLDMAHVGMTGHSFGTYTAWAVAGATFAAAAIQAKCDAGDVAPCSPEEVAVFSGDLSEKRAKMVCPLAGGTNDFFGVGGYDAAKVPVLLMSGSLNDVGDGPLFDAVAGVDLTWVDVDGGCHQLFGLGNSYLGDASCQALPDEEGFAIVNPWPVAFARYHVLGDRTDEVKGIVEGTKAVSAKAHFKHKGP
jgi:predicted dienelactone hydrolase